MQDYFINSYFGEINQILSDKQMLLILSLEKIFKNNLRDDFGLLCTIHDLYQTCAGAKSIDKDSVSTARITEDYRFTELLAKCFGLSERYIYILLQISSKFIDFAAGCKYVSLDLATYSISKLQELLPLSVAAVREAFASKSITHTSTRKEIRAYVKSLKGTKVEKVIDEKKALEQKDKPCSSNDISTFSITLPVDIVEFCTKTCEKRKLKLDDYIIEPYKKRYG